MSVSFDRPEGLHLLSRATLAQLLEDETIRAFADGLLSAALTHTFNPLRDPLTFSGMTLTEALHHPGVEIYPLLTALLALDAEIQATVGDEQRILSLPGFLSYRPNLALDKVPLDRVRLPPLNPGGRYHFVALDDGACLVIRLDVHPHLKVAGHVRLVVSSPTRPPVRLLAAEQRLDRQVLTESLIETAIDVGSQALPIPLSQTERLELVGTLKELIG